LTTDAGLASLAYQAFFHNFAPLRIFVMLRVSGVHGVSLGVVAVCQRI